MDLRMDILLFPGGRSKVFTLSFDDGVVQDRRFVEMLKKYDLKCTFNLNSGSFGQVDHYPHVKVPHEKIEREEVVSLYKDFEIATHSVHHPSLSHVPTGMAAYEVVILIFTKRCL